MDSALRLKLAVDQGVHLTDDAIDALLSESELIKQLTAEFNNKSLFAIWRLIALSEIPYAGRLKYTQDLIRYIEKTFEGFSITGQIDGILPCYNAMLIEAFTKLGIADKPSVGAAIEWIIKYQVFDRGKSTTWHGSGIKKYGGCMKDTPCYIGIAKSVKALIYYSKVTEIKDASIEAAISSGTDYLLKHQLFKRMSDGSPITTHILDIAYPPSYQLNILELLDIAYMTGHMNHPAVKAAIDYIKDKQTPNGDWKISYSYKAEGFVSFDKRGKKGEWVSAILEKYLAEI